MYYIHKSCYVNENKLGFTPPKKNDGCTYDSEAIYRNLIVKRESNHQGQLRH